MVSVEWRQLRLPVIITTLLHYYYIVPAIRLLTIIALCLHLIITSVCALFFLNFRRGGTSEERENMLSRGQGMVGNQDTCPVGYWVGW